MYFILMRDVQYELKQPVLTDLLINDNAHINSLLACFKLSATGALTFSPSSSIT